MAGTSLFLEPMKWMAELQSGEVQGKLYCPGCARCAFPPLGHCMATCFCVRPQNPVSGALDWHGLAIGRCVGLPAHTAGNLWVCKHAPWPRWYMPSEPSPAAERVSGAGGIALGSPREYKLMLNQAEGPTAMCLSWLCVAHVGACRCKARLGSFNWAGIQVCSALH